MILNSGTFLDATVDIDGGGVYNFQSFLNVFDPQPAGQH